MQRWVIQQTQTQLLPIAPAHLLFLLVFEKKNYGFTMPCQQCVGMSPGNKDDKKIPQNVSSKCECFKRQINSHLCSVYFLTEILFDLIT